ncbi:MAG: hypothetical protein PHC34_06760 [Candidatus Gastranaerophilales bacterium]|nr:hypothetical protein [Candidatus Gastranaerophilales bacterium]
MEYYNNSPGMNELNLYGIEKKREIISTGAISPDKSMMTYSVVYFYPNNRQFTSKVFLVANNFQIKTTDKIAKSILESGLDSLDKYIFRTLTVVDWSSDSKKLLIKETVGEYLKSIWATNIWVYNFDTENVKRLDNIKKAIVYYWKINQNLDLDDYKWDIVPLGWDINNPDMVIVNAYGYGDLGKQFLGCWSIDTFNGTTKLLSLFKQNLPVAKNGFKFVPKK